MVRGFILMSSIQARPSARGTRHDLRTLFSGKPPAKGAVKGSGLGLSIARDCIRRIKGNCIWSTRAGKTFVSALNSVVEKHEIMLTAYPIRLFYLQFGPGQCSKSSRTTCTLRFLALSMSKLSATITPTGIGFKLVNMRHIFQRLLPRRLWLAGCHVWHCWVACRITISQPLIRSRRKNSGLSTG